MANCVDPDQLLHSAAADLGLHCLLLPICPNTYGYYGTFCHVVAQNTLKFEQTDMPVRGLFEMLVL